MKKLLILDYLKGWMGVKQQNQKYGKWPSAQMGAKELSAVKVSKESEWGKSMSFNHQEGEMQSNLCSALFKY